MAELVPVGRPLEALLQSHPIVVVTANWDGYGHATRDISIMRRIADQRVPVLSCSQKGVASMIQAHFSDVPPTRFGTVDLDYRGISQYDAGIFLIDHPRIREPLRYASAVLTDFVPSVSTVLAEEHHRILTTGVYHSLDSVPASPEVISWQERMLDLAKPLDALFHMTLADQPRTRDGVELVSINPIAREITRQPEEIKQELGLAQDEEYILIASGMNLHPAVSHLLQEVHPRKDGVRYVVQIGNGQSLPKGTPKHLIWANAKLDGHNYANAAEAVIAKPGFGMITDCIKGNTPILLLPHEHPEGQVNAIIMSRALDAPLELDPQRNPNTQIDIFFAARHEISARMRRISCDGADKIASTLIQAREQYISGLAN